MYNRFKQLGVPVAITRDSDVTLTREERLNTMNNTFGTSPNVIILSNHINSGGEGFSYHYKDKAVKLKNGIKIVTKFFLLK